MAPSRLVKRLLLLALCLLATSTFSYAALPLMAPGMTQDQTSMVQRAFLDAMVMAREVALTFDTKCDPVGP